MPSSKKILFIVGPTAVGKSDVALLVAQKLHGEIVCCDSMQVYKEITVASNKPRADEQRVVAHHMTDVVAITEPFDVVAYNRGAVRAIEDILSRGKLPMIVGGSGMYMQVLLDGIFEGAPADEALRATLMQELEKKGKEALYARLKEGDPQAAAKIHPNNTKRLIRALEVLETQDKSFTELKKQRQGLWGKYDIQIFCLHQDRAELYETINERVEKMIADGLIEEVKSILPLIPSKTADVLIGIKEIRGYLEGAYGLDQAKYLMKRNTRHLAKRQLTWFRKEDRAQWVLRQKKDNPEEIAQQIIESIHE